MRNKENNKNDELELTIAHLAQHMQALRDAVPVNYELKAKLKKRLLEQLKQKQAVQGQSKAKKKVNKKQLYIFLSLVGVMAVLIAYLFWPGATGRIADLSELGTFSVQDLHSERPITVSTDGRQIVLEQQGSVVLINSEGEQRTLLKPAEEQGVFHSPAWTNQGDSVAVVYEHGGISEIWVLQQSLQFASRPIYAASGVTISNLAWSTDDQWVEFTETQVSSIEKESPAQDKAPAQDSHTLAEGVQVRHDGSEVARGVMIETQTEQELRESLARIKWPRAWLDKLSSASQLWVDWNGNETALVVGVQAEGQERVEIVLVQLKQNRLLPPKYSRPQQAIPVR